MIFLVTLRRASTAVRNATRKQNRHRLVIHAKTVGSLHHGIESIAGTIVFWLRESQSHYQKNRMLSQGCKLSVGSAARYLMHLLQAIENIVHTVVFLTAGARGGRVMPLLLR
jgi:hypothetical protein